MYSITSTGSSSKGVLEVAVVVVVKVEDEEVAEVEARIHVPVLPEWPVCRPTA